MVNVLHAKKEEIYPAYLSKHNLNLEKQVIFSNDSKQKKMPLPRSTKTISVIKRNNIKK